MMLYPVNTPRTAIKYLILAAILLCAYGVRGANAWEFLRIVQNPAAFPDAPFPIQLATRTIGGGPLHDNQVLAIDGKPLHSYAQFGAAWQQKRPGETLRLTLRNAAGATVEKLVRIPSQATEPLTFARAVLGVCTSVLIPLLALTLGAVVVALRPNDGSAWILMLLMTSFAELLGGTNGPQSNFVTAWNTLWSAQWPVFMMLFGIFFPERAPFERKRPWLKYLFLIPCAMLALAFRAGILLWYQDIDRAVPLRSLMVRLYMTQMVAGMIAISIFFFNLGTKSATATSADSRRRLRILLTGCAVSLSPMFLVILRALLTDRDPFDGMPSPLIFLVLAFFSLFPLTLAYVIVVERAMDLQFVIRQSVRYGFARVGLWLARAALVGMAVYLFSAAGSTPANGTSQSLRFGAVGLGLLVLRRKTADGASLWIDRQFFREAYDAEHVLTDLASEAGRYIEIDPLLEKVTQRISDTLHVPDIVVLIRDGEYFVPRRSTRPGEPMPIPVDSRIAQALRAREAGLEVYFDKPPAWILALNAEELQTLDFMRTQLLLPIFGRFGQFGQFGQIGHGQLAGIISLGPKRSEIPYSATDIRLLQAVASQMALALENARLAASLAHEAAERERANRELEIAREVQERLFPQNFPPVPGLDCAGYCRPARGVGGDYYDFLALDDGRLGIAVGDVSGKGIAAALLMASLQASLRGQTLAGLHDLSALMSNVNRLVYDASTSNRYATFFYGEYAAGTRKLTFVNAGHNPPVILRGSEVLRLEAGGPVVGLLPGVSFSSDEVTLQAGDILISFTDGISEALNEQEEEWEEDRFIAAATACRDQTAKQMIDHIFSEADAFTGTAKQYDDMTLLVMKLEAMKLTPKKLTPNASGVQ